MIAMDMRKSSEIGELVKKEEEWEYLLNLIFHIAEREEFYISDAFIDIIVIEWLSLKNIAWEQIEL